MIDEGINTSALLAHAVFSVRCGILDGSRHTDIGKMAFFLVTGLFCS